MRHGFVTFTEACDRVRKMGLSSREAYYTAWKAHGPMLRGVPPRPSYTYRKSGWTGWLDFIGPTHISTPTESTLSRLKRDWGKQKADIKDGRSNAARSSRIAAGEAPALSWPVYAPTAFTLPDGTSNYLAALHAARVEKLSLEAQTQINFLDPEMKNLVGMINSDAREKIVRDNLHSLKPLYKPRLDWWPSDFRMRVGHVFKEYLSLAGAIRNAGRRAWFEIHLENSPWPNFSPRNSFQFPEPKPASFVQEYEKRLAAGVAELKTKMGALQGGVEEAIALLDHDERSYVMTMLTLRNPFNHRHVLNWPSGALEAIPLINEYIGFIEEMHFMPDTAYFSLWIEAHQRENAFLRDSMKPGADNFFHTLAAMETIGRASSSKAI